MKYYLRKLNGIILTLGLMIRMVQPSYVFAEDTINDDEISSINQFFKILGSVHQQRGLCEVKPGSYEITIYSSCCNVDKGIYYYTTYDNSRVHGIDMHAVELDNDQLSIYPLVENEEFSIDNRL